MSILDRLRQTLMSIIAAIGNRSSGGGSSGGGAPAPAYLYSLTLSGPTSGVATYDTAAYTVMGTDQYGASFAVTPTFASGTPSVATIHSGTGIASPLTAGTTVITATAVNSLGQTITANVVTLTVANRTVTSIVLSGPTAVVVAQNTAAYTAVAKDQNGTTMTGQTFVFRSSATNRATINSSTGVATGVSAGATSITATCAGVTSNAITLTVGGQVVTSIDLSGPTSVIATHSTAMYSCVVYDQNGNVMANQSPNYNSGSPSIATINTLSGVATGVAAGTSNITASIGAVTSDTVVLTVSAQVATGTIAVTPSSFTIPTSGTQQLTAVVSDQGSPANPISGAAVSWGSNATGVATVNGSGLVTGVSAGSATITATSGAASGTSSATISTPSVTSITISPSPVTGAASSTKQLTVTTNTGVDVTSQCTFSSNNVSIAYVDFQPTLTVVSPTFLAQGATSQVVTLTGTGFTSSTLGQSVVFTPSTGITINSTTFVNSTTIQANVSIAGGATAGARTVQVNDSGHGNTGIQTFSISASAGGFHWAWAFQDPGDPLTSPPAYAIVVSDPSNGANPFPYPQTASGKPNWGLYGFSGTDHVRTKDPSLGQVGGLEFQNNNGTQAILQIAVPIGTFDVNLALGDISSGQPQYCYIYDGATLIASVVNVVPSPTGRILNLSGTSVVPGSWSFNTGKQSLTFSSGTCYVKFGSPTAQTQQSQLVTFELNQTS